ncbi:hypothetical protein NMG60_11024859 [Bertholletia excelsa]
MSGELASGVRRRLLEFLIRSAHVSVLHCNFPFLAHGDGDGDMENWLLHPIQESNLQLFALISIWISSKLHDSHHLSVKSLKSLGEKMIKEQHFITRDFLEAVMNFEIGTSNIAFKFLEELFIQFKEVSTVGKLISFEACMDILDLLYEKEWTSKFYSSSICIAASVLIAAYVIAVPKQRWEFPILPWGNVPELDTVFSFVAFTICSSCYYSNQT